ncbi:hypothetical protein K8Z61_13805 [Nocardioides sp. TRM66260-LWL]|uniref:hypothetical protein n=1 Tax=Nocardioides sp. TRM66260-LWL TaxID=2874478 RepID=UPI001CC502F7|nr:hypothetical protein [Nocardioides sp. TRM66260-LWL]MBZ5735567.1 hypothetical protein [Nocardioides sp. TRM66260-LWL]
MTPQDPVDPSDQHDQHAPDGQHDPDGPPLDPRAEAELRRLLADARHAEPMPSDVAARLDDVLARLRSGESDDAPVVALDHHRRRAALRLLGAAAVVVLLGGLGARLFVSGDDRLVSTAQPSTQRTGVATDADPNREGTEAAPAPASGNVPAPSAASTARDAQEGPLLLDPVPTLAADDFVGGAEAVRADLAPSLTGLAARPQSYDRSADAPCAPTSYGEGRAIVVQYDGMPALLVLRAASGQTQVADLLQCGTGEVIRTATLEGR